MGDINDADYGHTERICKDFEIKTSRRISWFICSKGYIIFGWCIWELYLEIYEFDPTRTFSAPGLA